MPKKKKRVILMVETSREYGRGIISGVIQYVRKHENWNVYFEDRGLNEPGPVHFSYWDGIISRSSDPHYAKTLQNSGVPTIELLSTACSKSRRTIFYTSPLFAFTCVKQAVSG